VRSPRRDRACTGHLDRGKELLGVDKVDAGAARLAHEAGGGYAGGLQAHHDDLLGVLGAQEQGRGVPGGGEVAGGEPLVSAADAGREVTSENLGFLLRAVTADTDAKAKEAGRQPPMR
jgi:hypothetical protein